MQYQSQQKKIISICCLLVAIFVGLFILKMDEKEKPMDEKRLKNIEIQEVNGIKIQHDYLSIESPRRPGEIREIQYITIHETDNRRKGADAKAHESFLVKDPSDITGWHYTVDDHAIYHHIPDNEIAWNAGDGRHMPGGNINGIGIEMSVAMDNDFETTLENTATLVASLMHVYDIPMEDVKLHQHFMDKVCPHRLITEGRVNEFYKMIQKEYAKLEKE